MNRKFLFFLLFLSAAAAPLPAFAGVKQWMDYAKAQFFSDPDALFRLAFLMERSGDDSWKLGPYYEVAARQGHAEAANRLGLRLEEINLVEAVHYHKTAVRYGEAPFSQFSKKMHNRSLFHGPLMVIPSPAAASALRLGILYRGEAGHFTDSSLSDEFYQKAAEAGAPAWVIGDMYALIHQDHKAAVEWYKKETVSLHKAHYKTGLSYEKLDQPDDGAEYYKKVLKTAVTAETESATGPAGGGFNKNLTEEAAGGAPSHLPDASRYYNKNSLTVPAAQAIEEAASFFDAEGEGGKRNAVYQTAAALSLGRLFASGSLKTGLNMHQAMSYLEAAVKSDVMNSARSSAAQILQTVWEKTQDPADKRLTIDWLTQAKESGEISVDQFNERLKFLDSPPESDKPKAASADDKGARPADVSAASAADSCSAEWRALDAGGKKTD